MKNQTIYTSHYNATYSFENEVGLIDTEISWISGVGKTEIIYEAIVIDINDGHNEVINFSAEGGDGKWVYWSSVNFNEVIGTIELWVKYMDKGQGSFEMYFYGDGGLLLWRSFFNSLDNKLLSDYGNGIGGTTQAEIPAISDIWYHLKWSWDCNTDKYSMWVNQIIFIDDENFRNDDDGVSLRYFKFQLSGGGGINALEGYVDAIGYSWDSNYNKVIVNTVIPNNDASPNDWLVCPEGNHWSTIDEYLTIDTNDYIHATDEENNNEDNFYMSTISSIKDNSITSITVYIYAKSLIDGSPEGNIYFKGVWQGWKDTFNVIDNWA